MWGASPWRVGLARCGRLALRRGHVDRRCLYLILPGWDPLSSPCPRIGETGFNSVDRAGTHLLGFLCSSSSTAGDRSPFFRAVIGA